MNILSIQHVTKNYTGKVALNNVSIDVPEGVIYGLLGPNGAGKTTLIRIINQITAPDSGSVFFKDELLNNSHIFQIGYMPEERGLYKKMSIADQLLYFARLKGLSRNEAARRIQYWFEKFGMVGWKNKKIEDLSKGMQQKIQFVATVLHQPSLLILDEPFTGLDPINADLIRDEILELKRNGTSIIFSTHRMESVEMLCDYITLLNLSNKVLEGKTADIKKQFADNTFSVMIAGVHQQIQLPETFHIKEQSVLGDNTVVDIGLDNRDTNTLIQAILPHYQVLEFTEKIPSINDIFKLRVAETGGAMAKGF